MKKGLILVLALMFILSMAACGGEPTPPSETSAETETSEAAPSETSSAAPASTPTPAPAISPTPTPFGEEPVHAGSGDVLFDIYEHTALVDLNSDGTPEELTFAAGDGSSTMQIGSDTYTIDRDNQAQLFAVTDVDISDGILEMAFTDEYDSTLADTEFPFTYLYWWNGTDLIKMGGLMDMKFAGARRIEFNPADNFDAHGTVMCLTGTQNFTDIWYTGHYVPNGPDRKLKEKLYKATPLFHPAPLTTKTYILLLNDIDTTYFDFSYQVMWDYASECGGYAGKARDWTDDVVAFIPQAGEELTVVKVYGKKWFKLQAADGKSGWLKCEDMKVYGYWPTMGNSFTAYDLFDGIVVAG